MTERVPLIFNTGSNQIEELPVGDGVDFSGSSLNAGIVSATAYSTPDIVNSSIDLDNSEYNYMMVGPITVGVGATITVGAGVSYVVV